MEESPNSLIDECGDEEREQITNDGSADEPEWGTECVCIPGEQLCSDCELVVMKKEKPAKVYTDEFTSGII